jgi:hypothetical protein
MAAKSRTIFSRVLCLEYLLKPMPTAMSAEIIQTVMSVPVTTRKTFDVRRSISNCSDRRACPQAHSKRTKATAAD